VHDHIQQGNVDLQRVVVADEAELAEFVHESTHGDRVAPSALCGSPR
jgi:hypothetical protein